MSNIYSIGYCELAEIRVWKIQDHLDLVPGGPVSGYAAILESDCYCVTEEKKCNTNMWEDAL